MIYDLIYIIRVIVLKVSSTIGGVVKVIQLRIVGKEKAKEARD